MGLADRLKPTPAPPPPPPPAYEHQSAFYNISKKQPGSYANNWSIGSKKKAVNEVCDLVLK